MLMEFGNREHLKEFFIIEVKCIKILNFSYGNKEYEVDVDVIINLHKSSFTVANTGIGREYYSSIDTQRNIAELFCLDENNKPFTLFDCTISLKNSKDESVLISWCKMVYGVHEKWEHILIEDFVAVFENDRNGYRAKFYRENYNSENFSINFSVNTIEKYNNRPYWVIKAEFKSAKKRHLNSFLTYYKRMLGLHYLYINCFPNFNYLTANYNGAYIVYFEPFNSLFSSSNFHSNNTKNFFLDNNKLNFQPIYNSWYVLYEKNEELLNLFYSLNCIDMHRVEEEKTSLYVQLIEGLFDVYYDKKERPVKYSKKTNKDIINLIKEKAFNSDEFKNLCEKIDNTTLENIEERVVQSLGQQYSLSLKEKILHFIELDSDRQLIFKHENDSDELGKLIRDMVNHRNWLAHMKEEKGYIYGDKNHLVQEKLSLLFRVSLCKLLNIEINSNSLINVTEEIDAYYINGN